MFEYSPDFKKVKQDWKETLDGKSWYTRFVGWLNQRLNPTHKWLDYDSMPNAGSGLLGSIFGDTGFSNWLKDVGGAIGTVANELTDPNQLGSLVNSFTGAHLTGSQREANQMQMQNVEDLYQHQVTGMQNAGLNPALMYQGGASGSAPTVQGSQGTANMSELMQAFLLKRQADLLDSQKNKTDAETDNIKEDTEHIRLINKYYPQVTENSIKEVLSRIGVNEETQKKLLSEIDGVKLDNDLKEIQKIIQRAQADESSAYYKATRMLAQAQTEEAKEKANEAKMKAFMEELEGSFMQKYGAKMGSSEWIAIASAISSVFGIDLDAFGKSPFAGLYEMFKDWYTRNDQGKGGNTSPTGGVSGSTGGGSR